MVQTHSSKKPFKFQFHLSIVAFFVLTMVVMTVLTVITVLSLSSRYTTQSADKAFTDSAKLVRNSLSSSLDQLVDQASYTARVPGLTQEIRGDGLDFPLMAFFLAILDGSDELYSVYVGHGSGDFIQLIRTRGNQGIISAHAAPSATAYIVRTITREADARIQNWTFLDIQFKVIDARLELDPPYKPQERPWFADALAQSPALPHAVLSLPYLFNSLQAPGITSSRLVTPRNVEVPVVLGMDLTLSSLQELIDGTQVSANGGLLLVDSAKKVLGASKSLETLMGPLFPALGDLSLARSPGVQALMESPGLLPRDLPGWLSSKTTWNVGGDRTLHLFVLAPRSDFTTYAQALQWRIILSAIILMILAVPPMFFVIMRLSAILKALAMDATRVKGFDFAGTIPGSSLIVEFDALASGFTSMKQTLAERTETLDVTFKKLELIVDLGIRMSSERDVNHLAELILQGAKSLAHADAGSLYLRDGDHFLRFQIVLNDTLGIVQGGTSGKTVVLKPVALYTEDGLENHHHVVAHAFHTGQTSNIPDAYHVDTFDFSGTKAFDESTGYRSQSFLTVPLKPRGGKVMGALQLINATTGKPRKPNQGLDIVAFSDEIQRFVEALAAEAATALYNRELVETQKQLFDALIYFIAGAIDTKSPYTGGHCARVPELAFMLAKETERSGRGSLAGFAFADDDAWREFRIGAWLHDCGKVTTPEYVVDKATKLETIYNRIHEIRTRFEVILRDQKLSMYEEIAKGADPMKAQARYEEAFKELKDDFAFVAECNLGGEFMAPDRVSRLQSIAQRTWVRNFDHQLGLSWEELKRYEGYQEPSLPAVEQLLADRPYHVIKREVDFYKAYEGYDFKVPVPEHLYNHGELYNLAIGRGTLTNEERFKINEHIMQTIVMLEKLPLPEGLSKVPRYAGTHHETLTGTGYPRKLTAQDLGIPERIMAIADIFEALTASDRPYKKAKTLSESVAILHKFKLDGHIDPELFDLFLSSGCYLQYAKTYLKPDQIDEVNILPYLNQRLT